MNLNERIFLFFNQKLANPFLDFLILFVLIPLASLLVFVPFYFIFSKKDKILGLYSLFSGFFLYWLGHSILKPLFHLPRPFKILDGIRVVGPWHPSPYSFPSTTTMLVFGLALPIFFRKKKIGQWLLLLAFLIALSVIYTGFHTPIDVLAGFFFSLLFVLFLEKILYNHGGK